MPKKRESKGYRIAKKRIAQAMKAQSRSLHLVNLDLTQDELENLFPQIAQLTALQSLVLSGNQLTTLPPEIGKLTALQSLSLSLNQLTTLPPEITQLTALQSLSLSLNQLTTLPPEIGKLTELQSLDLDENQLTTLPPEIGKLTTLQSLYLRSNQLTSLPSEIDQLTALLSLDLIDNQLTTLPSEIGQLIELQSLDLDDNQLTTLPPEIGKLPQLRTLYIKDNPLPAELLELAGGQGEKLIKFLRSQEEEGQPQGRRFDEAKVLLLGPGDVGKTWLLKALQGDIPQNTGSTKGIEIVREPLDLPHPKNQTRALHLNCWDFGGQDYYQITHQIFYSPKAIYLLVWKPRADVPPNLTDRLERIRLSAGRTAKVLIVSTHEDDNVPASIGEKALKEQFGDLIWGFFSIDSKNGPNGTGISSLSREIAKAVAQLEGMDLIYPPKWHQARQAVLEMKTPTISFQKFKKICVENGMAADMAGTFADIMEIQGKTVYFEDAATEAGLNLEGENIVVLDPQWLAKAIGFVIEDKETIKEQGILVHDRLKTIWREDEERDCPGYDQSQHGYLLWLMWKFDIAYKQDEKTSLVPERIQRNRPDNLYWTTDIQPQHGESEATLIARIRSNPPLGLIPALSAAVHPLRRIRNPGDDDRLDQNWRDGFFLDTARRGQAFVELRDRELWMVVRDKYPANLIDEIHETLKQIIEARWRNLEPDYRVPCIGKKNNKKCNGTHRYSRLKEKRGKTVECEDCNCDEVDVDKMLDGFDRREEEIMSNLRGLKEGQHELLASAHAIFMSLDPENLQRLRAPSMFTIFPDEGKLIKRITQTQIRVTCWCEHPDGPHPAAKIRSGTPPDYLLDMPNSVLTKCAPYISWSAFLIKAFLPLIGTGLGQTLSDIDFKKQIELMNGISSALPSGKLDLDKQIELNPMHQIRPEIAALQHLHDFLLSKLPEDKRWGDLRPVRTKSGQILWLCKKHADIQQPPIQKL